MWICDGWIDCIENGGVLISPFIHPVENDMRKTAVESGGSIVRITDNGFPERFSPSGSEFEMLGSGRLLLLGELNYNSRKQNMSYRWAGRLNRLAEMLASHPEGMTMRLASR